MGLPPACFYPLQAFRTGGAQALAQTMENFFRSGWDPLVLGGVDGSNAHPNLAGGGLTWVGPGAPYPPPPNPPPHLPKPWAKRLVVEMADETADAHIRKKGATGTPENRKPGIELVIDPTDATYGKVCFVAKQDKSKQIGSVIVENPVTVTNPKVEFVANYGKVRIGTTGAFDWELARNGTVTLDDNGTRIKSGRSALYLGGDDLSVERSAAGKMLLRDPSGGVTTPMLIGNAANSSNTAIKFGTSNIDFKRADDGAWIDTTASFSTVYNHFVGGATSSQLKFWGGASLDAGLARIAAATTKSTDGSTGFGDHALKHLLGYGAATGFRTKIDFGTPTADRTASVPNVTGTIPVASSITADKLFRFVGATGETAPAAASDNGTLTTIPIAALSDTRFLREECAPNDTDIVTMSVTAATMLVDASSLGGAGSATVRLRSASDYEDRIVRVKITTAGSGTDTILVDAASGSVEGGASYALDATARSYATFQSDGTDWWRIG